jgi:predicted nucleic acid-binding protein
MNRAYVDANVIIRLITDDPPDMADAAAQLFRRVDDGEVELIIDPLVIAECVWVLSSFYGFGPKEIAPLLASLVAGDGVVCFEKEDTLRALGLYENNNVDFIDAYLAVRMMRHRVYDVYSFDTHFDRLASVNRLEPQ